jgi:hypothetical protein
VGTSLLIAAHLFAVVAQVLAIPSGPWATPFGVSPATEPQFARSLANLTSPSLLSPLKMTDGYHFAGNRPAAPGVYFEVRLKDELGMTVKTVRIPDPDANYWVRHRQGLLAQALADDQPVEPRGTESIPAPNQRAQTVSIWDMSENRTLRLRSMPEHLLPRDHPVFRPSEWSLVLARSYVRHLCREHGAESGELIRHTREAVPPAVMHLDEAPPGAFDDLVSSFGELPR